MDALIGLLGTLIIFIGISGLIYPYWKMDTRKKAGAVMAAGAVLFAVAMAMGDTPEETKAKRVAAVELKEELAAEKAAAKSAKIASAKKEAEEKAAEAEEEAKIAAALEALNHNYDSVDGDEFLYTAGLSDDDNAAGQRAASIVAFRYKGTKDGVIKLTSDGYTITCPVDCRIVTMKNGYGKQRVAFNPASIVGAAIVDAQQGKLDNPE